MTITKAIHLQGAGVGNTVITDNNTTQSFSGTINYNPTVTDAGNTFELNGFTFQGSGKHFTAQRPNSTTPVTGLKVHDNAFNGTGSGNSGGSIALLGLEFGVFYHNTFSGNFISVTVIGAGWDGESYSHVFGSANYPFFEDNTFGNGTGEFVTETGQGGRLVFRHNTISGYACSGCEVFDIHGDQNTGGTTISSEIYHNSIDVGTSGTYRWLHHRGGQAIIANNTVSRNITFNVTEYRSWGGNGICTAYPVVLDSSGTSCSPANDSTCIEKQVHNAFYFNNTAGGTISQPGYTNANGGTCGSDPPWGDNQYLQVTREYWLPASGLDANRPATCTAGTMYGTTDTDKIYSCSATNVWTNIFTPYTYPHPFVSGSGGAVAPTPPTNMTAVSK